MFINDFILLTYNYISFFSVFTVIKFKPKLYIVKGYKQIRNFHKFRGKTKLSQSSNSPSEELLKKQSEYFPNLWKPFTFTIIVRDC